MTKIITEGNFDEIISSAQPVLIDFWATWCGPCRMMSPTVDEVASEYEGRAIVAKCNVDDCPDVASKLGIRSIPTLLFFKDGAVVDRLVGANPKGNVTSKLDNLI